MTTTPNNTIALSTPSFDALDAALLKSAVSPELIRVRAKQKREEIDEQLRGEAEIPFEAALQASVECINEAIEKAAIAGRSSTTVHPLSYFKSNLPGCHIANARGKWFHLGRCQFVNNTLSMRDYIERNKPSMSCGHLDTYFSGMDDSRLETLQKSREVFALYLADKLAPIFRKAGFEVDNQATIERKCNTKYVALVRDYLVISW
jgi:hypothetical protein